MEITLLSPNSIKIRSKLINFVVDPVVTNSKTEAEVIVSLGEKIDTSKVSDFRLIISGPGEYEASGVKISGEKNKTGNLYKLSLDRLNVCLAKASVLSKAENSSEIQIVIINTDEISVDKIITSMQPKVVILYGENALEAAKTIKEGIENTVNKYAVTFDKLPQEMEVVVLG